VSYDLELEGIGKKSMGLLAKGGFDSVQKLANAQAEELTQIKGIGEKIAVKAIEIARAFMETKKLQDKAEEVRLRTQDLKAKIEAAEAKFAGTAEVTEEKVDLVILTGDITGLIDTKNLIKPFADYAFNRSHATCYAMIGYQTAYLKAHFPTEFMAALMNSELDDVADP